MSWLRITPEPADIVYVYPGEPGPEGYEYWYTTKIKYDETIMEVWRPKT